MSGQPQGLVKAAVLRLQQGGPVKRPGPVRKLHHRHKVSNEATAGLGKSGQQVRPGPQIRPLKIVVRDL